MARNTTNLDKSIRFFWILLVSAKNTASLLSGTCANLNLRVRFDDAKIHISCESAQHPSALYNTQRSPGHHGQGSAFYV